MGMQLSDAKGLLSALDSRTRATYPAFWEDTELWIGAGWMPIVAATLTELRQRQLLTGDEARGRQIKEKFGELRFYWLILRGEDVEIRSNYTSCVDIRQLSLQTCETCGARGEPVRDRFDAWVTACSKHVDNREANADELATLLELAGTATLQDLAGRVDYTPPLESQTGPGLYKL